MERLAANLFAKGFKLLEAPKWRGNRLWVSDTFDNKVYALSNKGQTEALVDVPNRPSGLGFLSDGSLIIASAKDSKLLRFADGQLGEYADLSAHTTGWLNDFAVDARDRIYAGNFGYDFVAGEARKATCLHRVDPDGAVETVATEMEFPNGSVVTGNGRTLIVAETWNARLIAFDLNEDGRLSNRRVFADLVNRQPDGICADAEGGIWTGIYNTGEFVRVIEGGSITHHIQFEGSGISCTLGGAEGRTLFMTVFLGTESDMAAGKRDSAVYTTDAPISAPGFGERASASADDHGSRK
jgi:sugar lactone lactonase YvrE